MVAAIVACDAEPVAAIVSLDAIDALHPQHKRFFGDPYYIAFQQITRGLSLSALPRHENAEPETVSMVYAYQEEFGTIVSGSAIPQNQGRAESLWHSMKKQATFGELMGGYSSELCSNLAPLQAADLFAYEMTHEFENQLKRPNDGMRWPLKQILKAAGNTPLIKMFDLSTLLHTLIENGQKVSINGGSHEDVEYSYYVLQAAIRDNLIGRANA